MKFFDLVVVSSELVRPLTSRLGYSKIFVVGEDVEIFEKAENISTRKRIIVSDSLEDIAKALKQNSMIGVIPKSGSLSRKALDAIRGSGKLLFLQVAQMTCSEGASRAQRLAKARNLVRNALMARVPVALVSMAEEKEGLISSLQMLEVAGFLGMDAAHAKEALGALGGLL